MADKPVTKTDQDKAKQAVQAGGALAKLFGMAKGAVNKSKKKSTPPSEVLGAVEVAEYATKPPAASGTDLANMEDLADLQAKYVEEGAKVDKDVASFRAKKYEEDRMNVLSESISNPPVPRSYMGLSSDPDLTITYEDNVSPPILDSAQTLLRRLSPFVLQVEPPLVFGEDGGFLNRSGNSVNVNAFTAGSMGAQAYTDSRTALAQSKLVVGTNGNMVSSVQEFMGKAKANHQAQGLPADKASQEQRTQNLGEPAIADLMVAADIAWQLSAVMNAPPLVLLINPATLAMAYTKVQQYQERSRYGFIFHAWGEEQPKLSITARCGAFISSGRGVHIASKRDSAAWQNLMNAFHLYKNNGYIHDTVGKSYAHHFVGALSIHYDQKVYYGHMESFNFSYEEGNQLGNMEFSIEFTVSAEADLAPQPMTVQPMRAPTPSPSDPRYSGLENTSRNLPGEYSINPMAPLVGGVGSSSLQLTSQGRLVNPGDALLNTMVPDALYPGTKPRSTDLTGQPVGGKGWSTGEVDVPQSGQRNVDMAEANAAMSPFGLR